MGKCACGFTQDEDFNCDGSHKVAKKVKETIIRDTENLNLKDTETKMMIADTIKKAKP
jgi:CDGSH-type Zn-finger protein